MQYTLDLSQRWNGGRASYRKPGHTIQVAEYDVASIPDDATARAFIFQHHYAGTYPVARHRIGLYRRGELVGVAVFSHPCSDSVLTNVFDGPATLSIELGRFVLVDSVPGNGESLGFLRVPLTSFVRLDCSAWSASATLFRARPPAALWFTGATSAQSTRVLPAFILAAAHLERCISFRMAVLSLLEPHRRFAAVRQAGSMPQRNSKRSAYRVYRTATQKIAAPGWLRP